MRGGSLGGECMLKVLRELPKLVKFLLSEGEHVLMCPPGRREEGVRV